MIQKIAKPPIPDSNAAKGIFCGDECKADTNQTGEGSGSPCPEVQNITLNSSVQAETGMSPDNGQYLDTKERDSVSPDEELEDELKKIRDFERTYLVISPLSVILPFLINH